MSNGEYIWLIIKDTRDTTKFCDFLWILYYSITYSKMRAISEWIVMLDNASIHCSKITMKTIEKIKFNWMYLPPYSPMLAPVELLFRAIKNKMRTILHQQEIWFNVPSDRIYIFDTTKNIDQEWVKSLWKQFAKNAKASILRIYN